MLQKAFFATLNSKRKGCNFCCVFSWLMFGKWEHYLLIKSTQQSCDGEKIQFTGMCGSLFGEMTVQYYYQCAQGVILLLGAPYQIRISSVHSNFSNDDFIGKIRIADE